ncbi:hypothetical protein [Cellulomonas iranensis]|uniref:hypothetical protein n=1 Tax=Cellulomonas iranensis TaxID=76862 RepID=UPI0013D8A65A|nr:hypothetical protein [Cellulomonas iranensis]
MSRPLAAGHRPVARDAATTAWLAHVATPGDLMAGRHAVTALRGAIGPMVTDAAVGRSGALDREELESIALLAALEHLRVRPLDATRGSLRDHLRRPVTRALLQALQQDDELVAAARATRQRMAAVEDLLDDVDPGLIAELDQAEQALREAARQFDATDRRSYEALTEEQVDELLPLMEEVQRLRRLTHADLRDERRELREERAAQRQLPADVTRDLAAVMEARSGLRDMYGPSYRLTAEAVAAQSGLTVDRVLTLERIERDREGTTSLWRPRTPFATRRPGRTTSTTRE